MLGDAAVSKFIRGPISLNQILEFSKYGALLTSTATPM